LLATLNFRDTIRKGAKEVHTFSLNAMPTDTTANFKASVQRPSVSFGLMN
jgi:hypothetical protein